ncbi:hypothetical protein RF11_01863 [Thelohanellus kitauei]|uniref:Sortilin-related receptor n=1 Tax=Thelohanellus kitauei TaxID=669202 RepID=A0A0C2ICR3_THEKT|nr:hypothetical protein RF11_01863 [Thelohanellus kitauei]
MNLGSAKARFDGFGKYKLKYVFWKGAPNFFVFNFQKHNSQDIKKQTILVSKDGGKSFDSWTPIHDGKPILVDEFISTQDVLFGESTLNQMFFYADSRLKIFSIQKYEENGIPIPSPYHSSHIFKLVERYKSIEKDMIIRILCLEKGKDITLKVINHTHFGARTGMSVFRKYSQYFYLHGSLYLLVLQNASTLCLYTLNKYDQLIEIVCSLSIHDTWGTKSSVVINPHLSGNIFVNLKQDTISRTYISFDNGKNFVPIHMKTDNFECGENDCSIEMNLKCSLQFMKNNFPEKWIVQLQGRYYIHGSHRRHIFVSFNGGNRWKILDTRIEKLTILNRGSLMFGTEKMTGKIWYSYNEGWDFYRKKIGAHRFINIFPLESPDNLVIAGLDYNVYKKTVYTPRFFGNCFQGKEVYYLKKKPKSVCVDNRTTVLPVINSCPCAVEDFEWYRLIYISETQQPYPNTTCQIICNPLIKTEDFCYCADETETSKEYMCAKDDSQCLSKCKNGQCRRNNVRCNSVDDCGDQSDEEKCESDFYLN